MVVRVERAPETVSIVVLSALTVPESVDRVLLVVERAPERVEILTVLLAILAVFVAV